MNNINKVLKEFDERFPCNVKKWENNEWKEHYIFLDPKDIKQFITKALQDRDKELIEIVGKIELPSEHSLDDKKAVEMFIKITKQFKDTILKQLKERNV